MTDQPQKIELKAFTISNTAWKVPRLHHEANKAFDRVASEYDMRLSSMNEETFIVEPDGTILWPYRNPPYVPSLRSLLVPLMGLLPLAELEQYMAARRAQLERELGNEGL